MVILRVCTIVLFLFIISISPIIVLMREQDIYFIFILFNFGVDRMFILGLNI